VVSADANAIVTANADNDQQAPRARSAVLVTTPSIR
jgi:hypothetical protein